MQNVSINEVLNMYNAKIIDIRDNYTYNLGHIKNAIKIFPKDLTRQAYKDVINIYNTKKTAEIKNRNSSHCSCQKTLSHSAPAPAWMPKMPLSLRFMLVSPL